MRAPEILSSCSVEDEFGTSLSTPQLARPVRLCPAARSATRTPLPLIALRRSLVTLGDSMFRAASSLEAARDAVASSGHSPAIAPTGITCSQSSTLIAPNISGQGPAVRPWFRIPANWPQLKFHVPLSRKKDPDGQRTGRMSKNPFPFKLRRQEAAPKLQHVVPA